MRWIDPQKHPALHALLRLFQRRQYDYHIVFRNDQPLMEGLRAQSQRAVLLDLMRFCHADANITNDRQLGRREVWLYLNRFLRLDPEELAVLQSGLSLEERYQLYNPEAPTFTDGA